MGFTALSAIPAAAQPQQGAELFNADLARAKNLARQVGERENGGILEYRTELAMHGPAEEAPFVENADGSWTFTFQGCRTELLDSTGQCSTYTVESVVTVTPDNTVTLDANRTLPVDQP